MPVTDMDKIIPLWDAMQIHDKQYDSGDTDYSVTTLLDPPRVVHLNKRHLSKVQLYIKDLMHSFTGTAIHNYLEFCLSKVDNGKKYKCEERLGMTVRNRKISGAYDIVWSDRRWMYDLKTTSCWKVVFGDKADWTAQQNTYRYLFKKHMNIEIDSLRIIGMFRDWSMGNKFRSGPEYPMYPCMEYQLPIWEHNRTLKHIDERVELMINTEDTPDDDLPLCSYKDMWSTPDKVAVRTSRLKRALRVLDSKKEADKWVAEYVSRDNCKDKMSQISYEYRQAERKRCEEWCPVNAYCNQYNDYIKAKAKGGS